MLKRILLALGCALLVAGTAQGADVHYVLQTPGVV
jgi:hypothetical protein